MLLNEGLKTPKPEEFAGSVAQSDGYELAAAQIALAQSRNPQVRAFAERMVADHESMARDLRDAAKASGLEPPMPHGGGDQARFLASLQSLRGNEVDREYGRQQMLAHTSALTVMQSYAEKGSDSNFRRMAASSSPVIERHLQSARQLLQSLMLDSPV
jgi:putative membrane protein